LCVITSEQDKQIHSFDELETHTRSIVLFGVDSASCKSRHSLFLARNENENPSSETSRPLATLSLSQHAAASKPKKFQPENKFDPEIHEVDLWQVYAVGIERTSCFHILVPRATIILTCGRDRELWLCSTPEVRDSRTSRKI